MNGKLHLILPTLAKSLHPKRLRGHSRLLLLGCLSLSALLAFAAKSDVPSALAQQQRLAPVVNQNSQNAIPDQYMVIFEPGTPPSAVRAAQNTVRNLGGKVEFTYKSALIGFSARIPPGALQAVRA